MSEFKIGSKGGKDRYMVGWNADSKGTYKVGATGSPSGESSNGDMAGEHDSPTARKSGFSYKGIDPKDVGDRSDNMNSGETLKNGIGSLGANQGAAGEIELSYTEKGEALKRAVGRFKAYQGFGGDKYDSPTVDLVKVK